jgi:hypothetical protein
MEKRKNSDRRAAHDKKQRKSLIEEKLYVIKRYERNERTVDIVRVTGISESTLRTIRNGGLTGKFGLQQLCLSPIFPMNSVMN